MSTQTKTRAPQKGLLVYLFHSIFGSLLVIMSLCFLMATALLITGNPLVYSLFAGIGVVGPSYVVLIGMGGSKYGNWERFQISMPIRRSDLVTSQYLSMVIALILGIPFVALITAISYKMHESLFEYTLATALIEISAVIAVPLFMLGLLFPLSCTKIGEGRQEGLTFVCFLIAFAIPSLISVAGVRLGLTEGVPALISLALSVIVFVVSYVITKSLYTRMDF